MKPISPRCPDCRWHVKFVGLHGVWQGVCVNPNCKKTIVSDREVWKREDSSGVSAGSGPGSSPGVAVGLRSGSRPAMKVYVAASVKDRARAEQVADAIEGAGHRITFKWWGEEGEIRDADEGKTWRDDPGEARILAMRERQAVWDADALVLCGHEKLMGGLIEFGMAMAEEKPAIILPGCPRMSIFWYLPDIALVETIDEMLEALAELGQN